MTGAKTKWYSHHRFFNMPIVSHFTRLWPCGRAFNKGEWTMYFKKLELQGFKSFVDYSSLDLEKGITSIIGPNGCGKSNVVDSIRWVLGETSAKALRGGKMEDVIFNGTDQRKAVGMAEVSLTIDNQDHQLPIEQDEVTITRRTFRSGDSEYLINKATCRLRDIQELFLDTGIGRNAYSILEQGKIDLIVSSKPSDRRFVFEEAAGISKYKSRKDESLRKLDSTEQNFLRVNDIAAEVKRQINSLERQVQKARRYQNLKQELTTLEVSQGRHDLHERRLALRKIEHQWEEQRTQLDESEKYQSSYETELDSLIQDLSTVETELGDMQSAVHHLHEEMIKTEDFISSSELRRQDLIVGLERLQTEKMALHQKNDALTDKQSTAEVQKVHKQQELENVKEALNQKEERLNELENELKEKAAKVQDRQNQLLKIVDQMSSLRGSLKNLEIRRSEKEQQMAKLSLQLTTLQEQNKDAFDEKHQHEEGLAGIAASLQDLNQEAQLLGEEKEKLTNTLATLANMLDNFNKTLTKLSSRLTWIEELKDALDGYESGAKSILLEHHAHPDELPGIIGPLVNFIRTDQVYERALEAFLGHRLQHILVETPEQARKAMAFLAQDNRGRATFIPMTAFTGAPTQPQALPEPGNWFNQAGVFGWASQLVRIDERFRAVFEDLLKNVVLVDNVQVLRQCRQAGATCTLVTLDGEIETSQGWITGGSKEFSEYGLLGRDREIEELKSEIALLEKNLAQAQSEEETGKHQLDEINGNLQANQAAVHEQQIKKAQMEKMLENITLQLQDVERQLQETQKEKEQFQQDLQQTLAQHDQVAQQLGNLELTDKQTQEELSVNQLGIESCRREYDERSLQAGELRVTAASLEQQATALEAETARIQQELEDVVIQLQDKEESIGRDQGKLEELAHQVQEKQEILVQLQEQKAVREHNLQDMQAQRQQLAQKRQEYEQTIKNVRLSLDSVHKTLHQLELQKTQLKLNLESLENYLVDEYKLNLSLDEEPAVDEEPEDPQQIQERIKELKQKLGAMGSVNLVAMEEYDELQERYEFLSKQLEDLKEAKDTLQRLINKINHESRARFAETFELVRKEFKEVFRRLFNGGDADLILVDESNLLETGIEIIARPPGKRLQNISLLSGGEKALTAIALLFSIFLIKPSPFCIFDEMDAPLDDTNTARFCRILQEFAEKSQFIVITHNKITMETAQVLYGVTMQESGVSKLISVKFKGDEVASNPPESAAIAENASLN